MILFFCSTGVITRYEVFLRGPLDPQNLSTLAVPRRVFYSSGWLDPSVSLEKTRVNRSEASPPESTTIIAGLQAFSTYQLRVVSINSAGSVTSDWTTARTEEGGLYVGWLSNHIISVIINKNILLNYLQERILGRKVNF